MCAKAPAPCLARGQATAHVVLRQAQDDTHRMFGISVMSSGGERLKAEGKWQKNANPHVLARDEAIAAYANQWSGMLWSSSPLLAGADLSP